MKRTSGKQLRTLDESDLSRVSGGAYTDAGTGGGGTSYSDYFAVQLRLFVFTSDGICWGWNDVDCTGQ